MPLFHAALLVFLSAPAEAASTSAVTVEALLGDWIHPAYDRLLRATHSQREAQRRFDKEVQFAPYYISFEKGEDGVIRFTATFTFHEGDIFTCGVREVKPGAAGATIVCDDGSDRGVVRFESAGSLFWSGSKKYGNGGGTFLRAGNIYKHAAAAALAGRYMDEKGEAVVFRRDGTVRWKGREHGFRIQFDCYSGCDTLRIHRSGEARGGEWLYFLKDGAIELWSKKEDENGFDQPDVLEHVLRRR